MIFSPESEACLHKGKSRIVVITLSKPSIEVEVESLKFLTSPVREICITSLALTDRLLILRQGLDIIRNCTFLTDISIAIAYHQLMTTGRNLFQQTVQRTPIENILLLADITIKEICKLQLKLILVLFTQDIIGPENYTCHRLDVLYSALQRNAVIVIITYFPLLQNQQAAGNS